MSLIRNLMTAIGVLAIFAVVFLFIKNDWFTKIASNPARTVTATQIVKVPCTYSRGNGTIVVKEVPGVDRLQIEKELFEGEGWGIPSRSLSYLHLVSTNMNKPAKDRQYHWRLSPNVKSVKLLSTPSSGATLDIVESSPSTPLQYELWITKDDNLDIEIELETAAPAPPVATPNLARS